MRLNPAGSMVEQWIEKTTRKFSDITIPSFVIMPNHVHLIVTVWSKRYEYDASAKAGDHMGSPLRDIIGWYKTMTTNAYIRGVKGDTWLRFNGRLWQRNYYEHIIRDDEDMSRIRNYIHNNPANWNTDSLYKP